MTAIAGLVEDGVVYIGGDSAAVNGSLDLRVRQDPKVFKKGDFLIGYTSSFRMGQLLRYKFTPPILYTTEKDPYEYMVSRFVESVRDCLKTGGYATKHNEEETGGTFMVGFRGHLFLVQSDYQVSESVDNYDACGCGHAIACGALCATAGLGIEPRKRIELALSAAERLSAGVRGPFIIESV